MLLFFAFTSIFVFWFLGMLIYVSNPPFTSIDDSTIYGKPLDNTPFNLPEVEITSPRNGESIHLFSELTIRGTSSDTSNTNCTILSSINNIQPFQNASAIGQREQDFSNWNSTFFNATNLLRPGKNSISSFIVCLDSKNNAPMSSSDLINLSGLPITVDNQSILSSVSRVIHDGLENKIVEQPESSDPSTPNLQNNLHAKSIHHNNDQSQSQSQSTLSPNSGQSTIENP